MSIQPQFDQEDEWEAFLERIDQSKLHRFRNYWWHSGRDEDDDGYLREAVFLEVPLPKDAEPKNIKAKLTMQNIQIFVHGEPILDENFENHTWLNVNESYWELEVKTVKKVRRKVLRYILYILGTCPKYITDFLLASEKVEDDGRYVDEGPDNDDNVDDRIRTITRIKEPEPRRGEDIWFSDTEEEEERWCEACGSTHVVVMKKFDDDHFKKYCCDCPHVSKAKMNELPTGVQKQRDVDKARAQKKKVKARKAAAKKRAIENAENMTPTDDSEEVDPEEEKKKREAERTRFLSQSFPEMVAEACRRGEIKWEDY